MGVWALELAATLCNPKCLTFRIYYIDSVDGVNLFNSTMNSQSCKSFCPFNPIVHPVPLIGLVHNMNLVHFPLIGSFWFPVFRFSFAHEFEYLTFVFLSSKITTHLKHLAIFGYEF
uniref:Uncharacterized protein n=1 Tax=Rhizophora mucronata TaxID=61149 RepID=A0A2P2Q7L6_RHIMU